MESGFSFFISKYFLPPMSGHADSFELVSPTLVAHCIEKLHNEQKRTAVTTGTFTQVCRT